MGPMAGCCECGDEPSSSGATYLVHMIVNNTCHVNVIITGISFNLGCTAVSQSLMLFKICVVMYLR
jgi:hypothetical protein